MEIAGLRSYVPESLGDAALRELISLIPAVGDLFLLLEMKMAMDNDDTLVAGIYGVNALPGPTLPFTHFIVYALRREK